MSKKLYPVLVTLLVLTVIISFGNNIKAGIRISKYTKECIQCHRDMNPGIVRPWEDSRHADAGIGCYECHQANMSDNDAIDHFGYTIAVIVSPKDCSRCHPQQVEEMNRSLHAGANKFTGSLDNILGRFIAGKAAFDLGCAQCHGSNILVDEKRNLVFGPWPNTGIGRLNPDGSNGTCTACHQRHFFSVKQAREPRTCGKCHQGPDHPDIEIYELSKHGIAFTAFKDKLNIDKSKWILGEDYFYAPTCVTCHMGGTTQLERTHDVGERIAWILRPVISKKRPDWEEKREKMKIVCLECHQENFFEGFFTQYDRFIELYNEKFARPAQDIIKFLKTEKVIDPTPFNEQVEIDFWHLWHNEGRTARHGAAMHGPEYAFWHGIYKVALNFYFDLIPHADEAVAKKGSAVTKEKWKNVKSKIMNSAEHKWKTGMPKEELRKIIDFYQKRDGKDGEQ